MLRCTIALLIASALSYNGYIKKSLDYGGSISAFIVGFSAFVCSYRFGFILILFYYSSSKFTKFKQEYKASIEEDYHIGGQRNWKQVFASSLLATLVALLYFIICGEDKNISFFSADDINNNNNNSIGSSSDIMSSDRNFITILIKNLSLHKSIINSYLWIIYIAHYATANADTWSSELGVLSTSNPRLVTTLFFIEVPKGTNGGMSVVGTIAGACGGLFIGLIYWFMSVSVYDVINLDIQAVLNVLLSQSPVLLYSLLCGILGSLIDSILGATLQITYYHTEKKCIVKKSNLNNENIHNNDIIIISGIDVLSNEAVNLLSILLTMILSIWLGPYIYCLHDKSQCHDASSSSLFSSFILNLIALYK